MFLCGKNTILNELHKNKKSHEFTNFILNLWLSLFPTNQNQNPDDSKIQTTFQRELY